MINFTVGPVQSFNNTLQIGSQNTPYFRTDEFSNIMFENEKLIKKFINASDDYKVAFLTASGTGAMEASIMNTLNKQDKVLIVNGGSFGSRFVELCKIHEIKYEEIKLNYGKTLTKEILNKIDGTKFTGFLVNVHETSTGVHYDMDLISKFCKKYNLFLIVDAISSFLADDFDMIKYHVDVVITSSQKALACPPGISILVLSKNAIQRINNNVNCLYFNLINVLKNAERGQTPFTPAVSILLQINQRLKDIENNGGIKQEIDRVKNLALDFRNKIKYLPFEIPSETISNAITPLHPLNSSADKIFNILKNEYDIWVCPNGGELKEKIFRVGHIGNLTINDNDKLITALKDMKKRNLI